MSSKVNQFKPLAGIRYASPNSSPDEFKSRKSSGIIKAAGSSANRHQVEVNNAINDVVAEVLDSFTTTVKNSQAKHLIEIMSKNFKFFKTAFSNLIDKILVIE